MRILACLLVAIASALPASSPAKDAPADRERALAAAYEVMGAARYAALVTRGGKDGYSQARVVDPLLGSDRTIWIATNPLTRKVEEIRRDGRVTLLFFNAAAMEYVTVHGRAWAVSDPATKAARWKNEWQGFYKDRHKGPDFELLEVRPVRYEVSSPRLGFANDAKTWKPVIVEMGGS
jgi:general stress protein 26